MSGFLIKKQQKSTKSKKHLLLWNRKTTISLKWQSLNV